MNYTAPPLLRLGELQGTGPCSALAELQGGVFCVPVDEGLCSCSSAWFGVCWSFCEDVVSPCCLRKCQMWRRQDKGFLAVG